MPQLSYLKFSGLSLSPIFDRDTYNYIIPAEITNPVLTITATSTEGLPILKINGYTKPAVWNSETNTITYETQAIGDFSYGDNTVTISWDENTYPGALTYKVGIIRIREEEPPKDVGGYFPIKSYYLPPDYYGGTYIPNYRRLREILPCKDGEFDYENNYENRESVNAESIEFLNGFVKNLTGAGKLDALVECFVHYSGFVNWNWVDDGDWRYVLPAIQVRVDRPTTLKDGYVPVNNKLFSYPYSALEIKGYGTNSELKYENFDTYLDFGIVSKFTAGTNISLYPFNYEGIDDNYDVGCAGQELPVFSYTQNGFLNDYNASVNTRTQAIANLQIAAGMQYIGTGVSAGQNVMSTLANQKSSLGQSNMANDNAKAAMQSQIKSGTELSMIGQAGATALQLGNIAGQTHMELASFEAQLADVVRRPMSVANQNASPSIPIAMKEGVVPYLAFKSIRKEFAEKIDEFFTKFGYKVSKVKIPDYKTRPRYNFLKCAEAHVKGDFAQDDLMLIKGILEKGITFWHDTENIGDYTIANPAPIR